MGLLTQTRAHSRVRLVTTERFAEHVTPPGASGTSRTRARHAARGPWLADAGGIVSAPRVASSEDLARVHSREHLQAIAATAGRSVPLDPDTYTSPESDAVARLAAGAVLTAVDQAMVSRSPSVAFVRPGSSCGARPRDGVLSLQQRCRGRGLCAQSWRTLCRGCRLRRPPWKRHAVDFLQRPQCAVCVDPPVSVLLAIYFTQVTQDVVVPSGACPGSFAARPRTSPNDRRDAGTAAQAPFRRSLDATRSPGLRRPLHADGPRVSAANPDRNRLGLPESSK